MANYKILETRINEDVSTSILNKDTGIICPKCTGNKEYDQFLQDVKEQGLDIVEGPDIVTPNYRSERENEYPSIGEQLDQLYWDLKNGRLDTGDWIQNITKIKLKHSKSNTGTTTIGELPQWVITEGTGNFP